ncbi:hypothetical protein [Caldicellulosiruptor morganii]|uniref:Uncharacterized protein n=1 Tax=Caldicellulosiruptor morganii TaxID=1387555 RepID=A0ABY7BR42_9FIRM|nr:hypothetical protein [Caldicellulosiruptor morganii]WAM34412.1 hypothetical protein OTK00_000612 [Caldicellulosiruptor morganii]
MFFIEIFANNIINLSISINIKICTAWQKDKIIVQKNPFEISERDFIYFKKKDGA